MKRHMESRKSAQNLLILHSSDLESDDCSSSISQRPANSLSVTEQSVTRSLNLPKSKMIANDKFWKNQEPTNIELDLEEVYPLEIKRWCPAIEDNSLIMHGVTADGDQTSRQVFRRISTRIFSDSNGVTCSLIGQLGTNRRLPLELHMKFSQGVPENWRNLCRLACDSLSTFRSRVSNADSNFSEASPCILPASFRSQNKSLPNGLGRFNSLPNSSDPGQSKKRQRHRFSECDLKDNSSISKKEHKNKYDIQYLKRKLIKYKTLYKASLNQYSRYNPSGFRSVSSDKFSDEVLSKKLKMDDQRAKPTPATNKGRAEHEEKIVSGLPSTPEFHPPSNTASRSRKRSSWTNLTSSDRSDRDNTNYRNQNSKCNPENKQNSSTYNQNANNENQTPRNMFPEKRNSDNSSSDSIISILDLWDNTKFQSISFHPNKENLVESYLSSSKTQPDKSKIVRSNITSSNTIQTQEGIADDELASPSDVNVHFRSTGARYSVKKTATMDNEQSAKTEICKVVQSTNNIIEDERPSGSDVNVRFHSTEARRSLKKNTTMHSKQLAMPGTSKVVQSASKTNKKKKSSNTIQTQAGIADNDESSEIQENEDIWNSCDNNDYFISSDSDILLPSMEARRLTKTTTATNKQESTKPEIGKIVQSTNSIIDDELASPSDVNVHFRSTGARYSVKKTATMDNEQSAKTEICKVVQSTNNIIEDERPSGSDVNVRFHSTVARRSLKKNTTMHNKQLAMPGTSKVVQSASKTNKKKMINTELQNDKKENNSQIFGETNSSLVNLSSIAQETISVSKRGRTRCSTLPYWLGTRLYTSEHEIKIIRPSVSNELLFGRSTPKRLSLQEIRKKSSSENSSTKSRKSIGNKAKKSSTERKRSNKKINSQLELANNSEKNTKKSPRKRNNVMQINSKNDKNENVKSVIECYEMSDDNYSRTKCINNTKKRGNNSMIAQLSFTESENNFNLVSSVQSKRTSNYKNSWSSSLHLNTSNEIIGSKKQDDVQSANKHISFIEDSIQAVNCHIQESDAATSVPSTSKSTGAKKKKVQRKGNTKTKNSEKKSHSKISHLKNRNITQTEMQRNNIIENSSSKKINSKKDIKEDTTSEVFANARTEIFEDSVSDFPVLPKRITRSASKNRSLNLENQQSLQRITRNARRATNSVITVIEDSKTKCRPKLSGYENQNMMNKKNGDLTHYITRSNITQCYVKLIEVDLKMLQQSLRKKANEENAEAEDIKAVKFTKGGTSIPEGARKPKFKQPEFPDSMIKRSKYLLPAANRKLHGTQLKSPLNSRLSINENRVEQSVNSGKRKLYSENKWLSSEYLSDVTETVPRSFSITINRTQYRDDDEISEVSAFVRK